MTTAEVANAFGRERTVYRAIKRTGMRWRLQKRAGTYVFSNDDVIVLAGAWYEFALQSMAKSLPPVALA